MTKETSMNQEMFGDYLKRKRLERQYTLRGFAEAIGFSPVFLCDIEKNRKPAPSDDRLSQIISLLKLGKSETDELRDLAAVSKKRPAVSNDLPKYIMENDIVRLALRTAKDGSATDEEWQEFIAKVNARTIPKGSKPPGD
jgi:transcriptional regulator with XRE-family HTH domain